MIAFVLSGGGNLGPLQIGALENLLRAGIHPSMLVGTSAGAVNAAHFATQPTLEGVKQLGQIWKGMTKEDVYPGGPLRMAWHLARHQDSFCSRGNMVTFLKEHAPDGIRSFHQLDLPLYIVATDLLSGHPFVFGEDPEDNIIEAILASTAIPPFFPPLSYRGRLLIDGGIVANLPIHVAVEKGAKEIYALDIDREGPQDDGHWNVWEVAALSLKSLIRQQWERDLRVFATWPGVELHHIHLDSGLDLKFDDFDHAELLIEEGRQITEAYLQGGCFPLCLEQEACTMES